MIKKHAVHVHVTKCASDNKFKVFVVIPVGAGATIQSLTVGQPDINGKVEVFIVLTANALAVSTFLERSFLVDANARFIQIDLNGQVSYKPYIGCNIDLDKYTNDGFDPCPDGNVACDVPYIASIPNFDETKHQLEILINNCANSYNESSREESGKSVKVFLTKVTLGTTGWQNLAVGTVSGATDADDYSAEVAGDPPKRRKTKIPITGHIVHPRKKPKQQ
jgi:hypothetical protein